MVIMKVFRKDRGFSFFRSSFLECEMDDDRAVGTDFMANSMTLIRGRKHKYVLVFSPEGIFEKTSR